MKSLLVRGARQLVTMRGPSGPRRGPALLDIGLIPDGALLIRGPLIQALGPSRQVQSLAAARDAEDIDASGRVVIPAFVDMEATLVHAHSTTRNFERLLQNYGNPDSEVFRDVLQEGARELSALSSRTLKRRAGLLSAKMLEHGAGTVEARSGYALDEPGLMKVLRVQSEAGQPLDVISSARLILPRGHNPDSWARSVCEEILPAIQRRRLAKSVDLEYNPQTLSESSARTILECAANLGFRVKVSAELFAPATAIPIAVRSSAASVGPFWKVTPAEIEQLGASSTMGVFTPGMALQTGMPYLAPGRAMVDAGVAPVLACGYHPELNPGLNMQFAMLLACRFYRWRPEEALNAATINGAFALGLASKAGSLEVGKQADLLILNASDYREASYYPGINIVDKTIKHGEVVYDSKCPPDDHSSRSADRMRSELFRRPEHRDD